MEQQEINWGVINSGGVFESLMHALLYAQDHSIVLFGRPGKDSGQDARSADGSVVYQAKFRGKTENYAEIECVVKKEFEQLNKYRKPEHANYRHWENVKKWVLYINIEKNPNNDSKWNEFITNSKDLLGDIEVELRDQTVIDQELIEFEHVHAAFFSGRNRVFLGLKEAYEMLSSEDIVELSYDKGYIGHGLELSNLKEGICNSDNRVIPVIGKKGSGITRFLYESLNLIGDNGWQVLWGLPASMSASDDWFKSLRFAKNTCFVIDCPDDIKLVKRVFEQLGVTERKSWKVIIACREEEHRNIIRFLYSNQAIKKSKIELSNLPESELKDLINTYYPDKFKEEYQRSLIVYTKGNIYLLLILCKVAGEGSTTDLHDYLQTYIDNCIDKISKADKDQCRTVLRYIALWENIQLNLLSPQPDSVLKYLYSSGVSPDKIITAIDELIKVKLIVRHGLANNIYSTCSPIIREQILREWLLIKHDENNFTPSSKGNLLIQEIISVKIPEIGKVLVGLSLLSISSMTEYTTDSFFEPIFDEINKVILARETTIREYLSILNILENIVEINPEKIVELLKSIRGNPRASETVDMGVWGKIEYDWEKVLAKNFGLLMKTASSVYTNRDAKKVLLEGCNFLGDEEVKDKDKLKHEIKNLITGKKNSIFFISAANDIMASDSFTGLNWDFQTTLFKGMLSPERELIERREFSSITIIQYQISPSRPDWDSFIKAREILISLLEDSEFNNISQRMDLWNILIQSHRECNDILTVKAIADEVMKKAYYAIIKSDLEKTNKILSNDSNISLEEKTCMKELWWWQLEKGEDTALIELAGQNEKLVTDASSWDFADLFRMRYSKEKNEVAEKIAVELSEVDTIDRYNQFFEECEKYLIGKEYRCGYKGALSDLAFYLIMKYDNCATIVDEFLIDTFNGNISQNKAKIYFGVDLASRVLKKKKIKEEDAVIQLKKYLEISSNSADLLYLLYSNASSGNIGELSEGELDVIKDNRDLFENDIKKWFVIMAGFSIDFWDKIDASELKDILRVTDESAIEVLKIYIDSLYIATIRSDNKTPKKENLDWIIDCIADNEMPGDSFDENFYSYRGLVEKCGYKMSLSQFRKLIDSRIHLKEKSLGHITLMPHKFSPDKWVNVNWESDEDEFKYLCTVSLKGGCFCGHYLPQYLSQLDPSGQRVIAFIEEKINDNVSLEDLISLSSYSLGYAEWSEVWLDIIDYILPICEEKLIKSDRDKIYSKLTVPELFDTWVDSPESITKIEQIKDLEENKRTESIQNGINHRLEFHNYRLERVEYQIKTIVKSAKEREWGN